MFGKKKQEITPPASGGPKVEASKEKSAKVEKLSGPRPIPGLVGKYLTTEYKVDEDLVRLLMSVVRKRPQAVGAFDCRIFDQSDAGARKIKVQDYTTLDAHPELVLYEGWFDENSKRVELKEKRSPNANVPLFTEAEILQKIDALKEPGSSVFFYQARGPALGGPLGQGAAVVELNPNLTGKKGKKYILHTANVIDMKPVAEKEKLFESDKSKEIAKWIKEAHHKRTY